MRKEVIKTDGESVNVLLNIIIKKEGDYYVAYCPALEVSSYGKTRSEAHKMFNEALEIFIEDTHAKGSFEKVLLQLGWKFPKEYKLNKLTGLISFGGSPRASINLALAAKAFAFIKRRGYVIPE